MKKPTINIYIKEPCRDAYKAEVKNDLRTLQNLVGGYIQTVTIAPDRVLIVNEEGLINGCQYNTTIFGISLYGPVLLVGVDGEEFTDWPLVRGFTEVIYRPLMQDKVREWQHPDGSITWSESIDGRDLHG